MDIEIQDIMEKYYQIKRNLIIYHNFKKDTELKFSGYTNILTSFLMMNHLYLKPKIVKTGGKVIEIYESVIYRQNFKISPFKKVIDKLFELRQKY